MSNGLSLGTIAIIVPVFNAENYLEQCLDSIICQKYRDFVVIAVNDGSTDRSREILDFYREKDDRIVVINQSNHGVAKARNVGLELAERFENIQYVSFVDSDDFIDSDFINAHIENLRENQADLSICGFVEIGNEKNNARKTFCSKINLTQLDFLKMVLSIEEWKSVNGAGGMVWKHVYRLSVIRGIRFVENRDIIEDEIFCVNISKIVRRYVYIPKNLYYYRVTPNSLSRNIEFLRCWVHGRKACWEVSDSFSEDSQLVIALGFINALMESMRNYEVMYDTRPYVALIIKLYKRKLIGFKTLRRFLLFCYVPNFTKKMYKLERAIRKLLKGN